MRSVVHTKHKEIVVDDSILDDRDDLDTEDVEIQQSSSSPSVSLLRIPEHCD